MIFGENASKKYKAIEWDGECEEAFRKLKEICTTTAILAYADFLKPFKLHTDACTLGLGAILYKIRMVLITSWGMQIDHSVKLRISIIVYGLFFALKQETTEQFHRYLYRNHFVMDMDNNPLTYILPIAKMDVTGHLWVASLANYNFTLHY